MPFVDDDGTSIHFQVKRRGRPRLLHHGFTQSLETWHQPGPRRVDRAADPGEPNGR